MITSKKIKELLQLLNSLSGKQYSIVYIFKKIPSSAHSKLAHGAQTDQWLSLIILALWGCLNEVPKCGWPKKQKIAHISGG